MTTWAGFQQTAENYMNSDLQPWRHDLVIRTKHRQGYSPPKIWRKPELHVMQNTNYTARQLAAAQCIVIGPVCGFVCLQRAGARAGGVQTLLQPARAQCLRLSEHFFHSILVLYSSYVRILIFICSVSVQWRDIAVVLLAASLNIETSRIKEQNCTRIKSWVWV